MSAPVVQRRTPKKARAFLLALARCGNVTEAAQAASVPRSTVYDWRSADPAFRAEWDAAAELGADALEDEARRRGHDGVEKPVYQSGELVGTIREYSDTLLIFLLKGAKPGKYRENVKMEHSGAVDVRHVIRQVVATLDAVLPHDAEARRLVADKLMELDTSEGEGPAS